MDTDQLIRTLSADNAHRARPVGFALMLALLAAAPVSMLMFFAELGDRPDVMTAMRNPFFDLKFAVTLALAIAATAVALHLSRPEASLRGFGWCLLIPAGLLVAAPEALLTARDTPPADGGAAQLALAQAAAQWIGYLTQLRDAVSRTSAALRTVAGVYAEADDAAALPYDGGRS